MKWEKAIYVIEWTTKNGWQQGKRGYKTLNEAVRTKKKLEEKNYHVN